VYSPLAVAILLDFLSGLCMIIIIIIIVIEDNIKMNLQEVGWGIDWIELAQDMDR
jgi:hypothetical protein